MAFLCAILWHLGPLQTGRSRVVASKLESVTKQAASAFRVWLVPLRARGLVGVLMGQRPSPDTRRVGAWCCCVQGRQP